jgi:hypothetical protein
MYVYADNAATTKMSAVAIEAMMPYMTNIYGNPSSLHSAGVAARRLVETAREQVARALRCEAKQITFVSSGTEANNQVLFGLAKARKKRGNTILSTDSEHPSVEEPLKALEAEGYRFEDAEGSLALRLREVASGESVNRFFELKNFRVLISESQYESEPLCSATIKIAVGGKEEITAAEGDGPVNALDLALRKALLCFYPKIASIRLCDYKVRVLDSGSNTASKVLVRVSTTDGTALWRTVGVSPDIIDASWQALSDSMIYFLEKNGI